jgi:hypothetical protein
MPSIINHAIFSLVKRAEKYGKEHLVILNKDSFTNKSDWENKNCLSAEI